MPSTPTAAATTLGLSLATVNAVVGALVLLGGLMGFARKGSLASLVAGGATGGLLLFAA